MIRTNEKGQAVIILLLIMVVGLTIGLSVVSRSILNVKLSTQSEESSRAFTAAEAGIEVALEQGSSGPATISDPTLDNGNSSYDCSKNVQGAGQTYIFYNVAKDRVAQLYFSDPSNIQNQYYKGGNLRIMWGKAPDNPPALELSLLYENKSDTSYHVAKFTLDPDGTRANSNHFCPPGAACADQPLLSNFVTNGTDTIGDTKFQFGATVNVATLNNLASGGNKFLIFGRFRLFYNTDSPTSVGVMNVPPPASPDGNFPSQGSIIDCLGSRPGSGVSRRIKVYENYPAVPEVFDYVLFNGNSSSGLGH